MAAKSPKVIAVCEDKQFLAALKGEGEIDAAKAEELARKAKEKHIEISFTCAGKGNQNIRCSAQLQPIKHLDKPSFLIVKGSFHCPGCEFNIIDNTKPAHLSYKLSNFSITEFHKAIAKGNPYNNPALEEKHESAKYGAPKEKQEMIDAQNLKDLYRKLTSSRLETKTQDGYEDKELIVDSRTYMLHRQGFSSIHGHPALILGMTTSLYKNIGIMKSGDVANALMLHDAFVSPNKECQIYYILQFDKNHKSAYQQCYNEIVKVAKKDPFHDDEEKRMRNNAIFLVEAEWERIMDENLLKELGCKLAFCGFITNKKQFTKLDKTLSVEDDRLLCERAAPE